MSESAIVHETKQWLDDVVIDLNFCPFAKKVFLQNKIHYYVDSSTRVEKSLEKLIQQCQFLDDNQNIETSFILYSSSLKTFNNYLDFLDLANELLVSEGYEGVYQIASFHPLYRFEGTEEHDAENYTNVSPYPMLHLLREHSLEQALKHYNNPEEIPLRNIQTAKQKGTPFFVDYLKSIKK